MEVETVLEYLNAVPVRATYGAVGDVLGIRPQAVSRLLGEPRPETSWIVNGSTGEPTNYPPDQIDPRLPGTHVIRTGNELRRCLENGVPAAPPVATPAVNGVARGGTAEADVLAMGGDAKWIIGTLVPVFLLVAGLLSAQIASVSNRLHTRIDDVHDRIDDLRADVTAEVAGVHTRIGEVRAELAAEVAVLRGIVARLDTGEPAESGNGPAPEEGERTADPDAAADPDVRAADPDAHAASDAPGVNPDPRPEPSTDSAPPAVSPVAARQ